MSFFNHSRYAIFCFKRFFINEVIGCIFKAAVQKDRNCNSNKNDRETSPIPPATFSDMERATSDTAPKSKRGITAITQRKVATAIFTDADFLHFKNDLPVTK